MALLKNILSQLRKQERQLARQLEGIRSAVSSLEFGRASSPPVAPSAQGQKTRRKKTSVKRAVAKARTKTRRMSAAAKKAVSRRMKKYWAERRKAKAK